jgi:hypothetical protein
VLQITVIKILNYSNFTAHYSGDKKYIVEYGVGLAGLVTILVVY